jgi:hypothetical protein
MRPQNPCPCLRVIEAGRLPPVARRVAGTTTTTSSSPCSRVSLDRVGIARQQKALALDLAGDMLSLSVSDQPAWLPDQTSTKSHPHRGWFCVAPTGAIDLPLRPFGRRQGFSGPRSCSSANMRAMGECSHSDLPET